MLYFGKLLISCNPSLNFPSNFPFREWRFLFFWRKVRHSSWLITQLALNPQPASDCYYLWPLHGCWRGWQKIFHLSQHVLFCPGGGSDAPVWLKRVLRAHHLAKNLRENCYIWNKDAPISVQGIGMMTHTDTSTTPISVWSPISVSATGTNIKVEYSTRTCKIPAYTMTPIPVVYLCISQYCVQCVFVLQWNFKKIPMRNFQITSGN